MSGRPRTFAITLSNVPIINLRWEFREFYNASHRPHFLHIPGGKAEPLETRYFIWLGMSDAAASMMVMRSIVGLEAYVCFAAHFSASTFGKKIPAIAKAADDPFKLGGGAADNFYNRLPALLDKAIQLKKVNPELWERTDAFYREIRNPLFHGRQFQSLHDPDLAVLFDHMADVYDWIDGWYDPEQAIKGAKKSFQVRS